MRRRTRTWPQRVVRYDAQHVTVPEALWHVARTQRTLWNDLAQLGAITAGMAKADPAHKRLHWWCFDYCARALAEASGLGWEYGPDVLDRYKTALTGIGKNGKGPPRYHGRLDRVRLLHRYTGGGMPAAKLMDNRGWRASLSATERRGYWSSRFGVTDEAPISFTIHEARRAELLPPDAIIKRVCWCGTYQRAFARWAWSLQITVEEPPPVPAPIDDERLVAGMDLGWRVMGESLRLGVLVDSSGETIELRLPFDGSNRDTRRASIRSAWTDMAVYQRELDEALEACKAALAPVIPETVRAQDLRLMRHAGLRRLLAGLTSERARSTATEILTAWDAADTRLRRRVEGLRARLIAQRRDRMRVLAKWLAQRYRVLAIEQDMSFKALAETAPRETATDAERAALKAAQQYRTWASLSEFRRYLTEAAARWGSTITGETADTTRRCAECGALTETGAALLATCPNWHTCDQDANAARNLLTQALSQTGAGPVPMSELRKRRAARSGEVLDIPEPIRAVAVRCSLE